MIINTNNNITALSSLNITKATDIMLQKSNQTSETETRTPADDTSGLSTNERMRSQILGYDMAVRNVQDGMSFLRTAESSLGDANDMLHRMRELSVQASDDTLTSQDRNHIQEEIDAIRTDYMNFNGKKLFDVTSGAFWSSSDTNLNIRTNEKSESDYRIEIKAEPGASQIQKSIIMNTAENKKADAILNTGYTEINIAEINESSNENWSYHDGTLTINGNGIYRITGSDNLKGNSIKISEGIEAYIIVGNVNLKTKNGVDIYFADDSDVETVKLASEYTPNTLREISQFYTSEGTFMLQEPQELTITQGDNKTASIMLYGEDTLYDVASKLNDAISNELGQGKYTDNAEKFSELTDMYINDGKEYSALVIRSAIPGREGELSFSGSEGVINALGLNTIQEASESEYRISIYDLNSDDVLAIQFGDMTSALGLDKVNVTTKESAMRSTAILDDSIDMVVRQRTQIASYSNALEHAVMNLSTANQITDSDMAKSTMRFVEFQILSKSENALLSQANQQPEAVYNLLGNGE